MQSILKKGLLPVLDACKQYALINSTKYRVKLPISQRFSKTQNTFNYMPEVSPKPEVLECLSPHTSLQRARLRWSETNLMFAPIPVQNESKSEAS